MNVRYRRFLDDEVRFDYLGLLSQFQESISSLIGDDKYKNPAYHQLFYRMMAKQIQGEPVTLEEMLSFISAHISKSTKLRLIDQAKRDGYIEAFRKSDLEDPGSLGDSAAKKAFYLSDDIFERLKKMLDQLIVENMKFVDFVVKQGPVQV